MVGRWWGRTNGGERRVRAGRGGYSGEYVSKCGVRLRDRAAVRGGRRVAVQPVQGALPRGELGGERRQRDRVRRG